MEGLVAAGINPRFSWAGELTIKPASSSLDGVFLHVYPHEIFYFHAITTPYLLVNIKIIIVTTITFKNPREKFSI